MDRSAEGGFDLILGCWRNGVMEFWSVDVKKV